MQLHQPTRPDDLDPIASEILEQLSQYPEAEIIIVKVQEQTVMNDQELLKRITTNPQIFNGKPIIRGRRLAVEHVLGMLTAGDTIEILLEGYPWLEREDVLACLAYAYRLVAHERIEPFLVENQ